MDEPESRGLIHVAANEGLDNLTFVINCNLQRLDGPVRGNGKIIQELEAFFRGAGWNVIKVIWGREWDALLHADRDGALINLMNTTPDGDYQTYKANDGAFVREHFFGRDPRTKELVTPMTRPGDLEPQARRPRLPQGLRRLPGRRRAPRPADRDPRQDDQGLQPGSALRGPQRDPPDEEDDPGRPQAVPGHAADPDRRRGAGEGPVPAAVLPPRPGRAGDPVPAGAAPPARRVRAGAAREGQDARAARRQGLRRDPAAGRASRRSPPRWRSSGSSATSRRTRRSGHRHRADHPGRGTHVRHGLDVPDAEDLQPARAAVHVRRRVADAVLQGERAGPDPARGHQRGRVDRVVHRGGHLVRHARRADDPDLHLLLDVRLPAHRRRPVGGGRPDGTRVRARRHRRPDHADRRGPAARRRALAAARRDQPGRASPTTRRGRSRSRTSCRTACGGCTASRRRTSSTT